MAGGRLLLDGKYQEIHKALHWLHSVPNFSFPVNFHGLPCAFLLTLSSFFCRVRQLHPIRTHNYNLNISSNRDFSLPNGAMQGRSIDFKDITQFRLMRAGQPLPTAAEVLRRAEPDYTHLFEPLTKNMKRQGEVPFSIPSAPTDVSERLHAQATGRYSRSGPEPATTPRRWPPCVSGKSLPQSSPALILILLIPAIFDVVALADSGKPVHRKAIIVQPGEEVIVTDIVSGPSPQEAEATGLDAAGERTWSVTTAPSGPTPGPAQRPQPRGQAPGPDPSGSTAAAGRTVSSTTGHSPRKQLPPLHHFPCSSISTASPFPSCGNSPPSSGSPWRHPSPRGSWAVTGMASSNTPVS